MYVVEWCTKWMSDICCWIMYEMVIYVVEWCTKWWCMLLLYDECCCFMMYVVVVWCMKCIWYKECDVGCWTMWFVLLNDVQNGGVLLNDARNACNVFDCKLFVVGMWFHEMCKTLENGFLVEQWMWLMV